jgi:nitrogen fixation/metabolism regulation signal transduction histidine kinase
MARQVAHEINNSLTPMKLTLQQLQRTRGTERFEQYFDKSTHMLIEQIDNLNHIAASFSSFAKMPEVTVSEVDVADKLVHVLTLMNNNEQHIPIRYVGPNDGIHVYADKDQIQQVFTNILRNALQALEERTDGDVIVVLKQEDDKVIISFSDNGGGIPEDVRSRIFTPNFTTKSYGTGLGLAIARNIVEGCDGSIRFETSEKGTTFFVTLNSAKESV